MIMAYAASGRARSCRFAHTETARAKPMHSKGLWRPDSEEFSAHPEPSRTPAAHARGRPASSRLLCELLDRILAEVRYRFSRAVAIGRSTSLGAGIRGAALGLANLAGRDT